MNIHHLRNKIQTEKVRALDLSNVKADHTRIPGRLMINGAGEAFADVYFNVKFIELPYFTYGFERKEGDKTFSGQMPTGSAYVASWKTIDRPPTDVY